MTLILLSILIQAMSAHAQRWYALHVPILLVRSELGLSSPVGG